MHSYIEDPISHPQLKKYASFLLNEHLEECIIEYVRLLQNFNLPLLDQFKDIPEEELISLLGKSLQKFLHDLTTGRAKQSAIDSIKKWRADELEEVNKDKISGSDILIIYSVRKQVFLNYLVFYTKNCETIIAIVKEIEVFFLQLEQYALKAHVEIQKEILVEEKEFSDLLLDNSIDGIIAWDQNFKITAWNSVLEKRYKILRSAVIGKVYTDIFPAYKGSKESKAMEKVLEGEKINFPENSYIYSEGYFSMDMVPLKDAQGKICGGISIIHDITDRKKAEKLVLDHREELQSANEELQAQQEKLSDAHNELVLQKRSLENTNRSLEKEVSYRMVVEEELKKERSFIQAILNNMSEGIVACDEGGKLSFFNQATKDFHGLPEKELEYKDWPSYFNLFLSDGITPMDPKNVPLYQAFIGKKVEDMEMVIKSTNGRKYTLSVNGQSILDKQGKKLGAVVVMHDISERKKAEEELIKSRDYYLTILEDFPALIWKSNTVAKCDYFNNTWLEYTGRTIDQELNDGWLEGVHPEDMKNCMETFLTAFHAKKYFSMQYRLKRHDGQFRWMVDSGKPLFDMNNNFLGFLGVCYDIHDQKEAEKEKAEKHQELLETLEKLKEAEEHLLKMNSELELRVKKRTDQLLQSEEELKQTLDKTIQLNEFISQREIFLSSIIDQSPVSTHILDANGTQIRVNNACLKLFGVKDKNQGLGKYNILKDELLVESPFYKDIKAVFTEGKVAKFTMDYNVSEVSHVSIPTGLPVTVITTIFPIIDASNKVINAVVQHEDITERKRAEEALKSSEEQLRLITDALPVLIAYVDKDEKYRFNNKAYENWFKISRSEMYGKTVREVVGKTAYASLQVPIKKALNGEKLYYEAYLPYKGAGQKYVAINYIPHISNNEVVGYYTLINDISKQKEIQRALETALQETNDKNEELQKINTDLDNFIYIASHDLKSPIVNLEGLMLALNKKIMPKVNVPERQILEMINTSIDKFKTTLKNLTEVAKAQKNLEEEQALIDLPIVIREIKEELKTMITDSQANIKEDLEVKSLVFVPMNLRSIVYNLLTNAIKYRKQDVPLNILIRTYRSGSNIVLSVKDNGLGLSESQQSKLFTMFKRMHSHVEGTGIGLYILKRIAENSGGKVEVESTTDVGTEFKVFFRDN